MDVHPTTREVEEIPSRPVPGPRPGFIGGHLLAFNRDPLNFLARCAREYGDFVELRFAGFPVFLVNHPDLIEEILIRRNRQFMKGRGLARTRDLLGNGLLTSEGEFWRRQRRLAQPAFHQQRIAGYGEIMVRQTERMLTGWKSGQAIDAHQAMMDLTMAIVAEALFSYDVRGSANVVSRSMDILLKDFSARNRMFFIPEWLPTPGKKRAARAIHDLDEVVYGIIAQRRSNPGSYTDLLATLLEARDETGAGMTDQQLRDEVMTLFLAGHETTANALSWAWMLLSQNPETEKKLHREVDAVLGGRPPTVEDIRRLPYAEHVVTESMRLYPPAWIIGRQAIEAVPVGGATLPEGAGVLLCQWVMHRHPRYYPDPDAFNPDRWDDEAVRRNPPFTYFPFGGGPRLCIGKPFAIQEAIIVLAMVAQRFCLALVPGQTIVPQPSITLRPRPGVKVILEERRPAVGGD